MNHITKLYKKTTCSHACLSAIEIADTPSSIEDKLKKLNAVETTEFEFSVNGNMLSFSEEPQPTTWDRVPSDIFIVKVYKTNMIHHSACVEDSDDEGTFTYYNPCTGNYCLVLIEMTEDIHYREMQETLALDIRLSKVNRTHELTVTKLYKKSICSTYSWKHDHPVEIADTPISIEEKLKKLNAVETTDFKFLATSNCADTIEDFHDVLVSKVYKTTEIHHAKCSDSCTGDYCLLLINMTDNMNQCEMQGTPSFNVFLQ